MKTLPRDSRVYCFQCVFEGNQEYSVVISEICPFLLSAQGRSRALRAPASPQKLHSAFHPRISALFLWFCRCLSFVLLFFPGDSELNRLFVTLSPRSALRYRPLRRWRPSERGGGAPHRHMVHYSNIAIRFPSCCTCSSLESGGSTQAS